MTSIIDFPVAVLPIRSAAAEEEEERGDLLCGPAAPKRGGAEDPLPCDLGGNTPPPVCDAGTFKCACTDTDGSPDPGTNPDPGTDTGPDPGTDTGPDPGPDTGERRFLEDYQDPEWVHLEIELDRILFARR